jgi:hypothetical protein
MAFCLVPGNSTNRATAQLRGDLVRGADHFLDAKQSS